ncbi:MAG: hypothetical protein IKW64_02285 [Clostridia bacterium]|nr:hypothetical protein [Clostridia bacterium]
MKNTYLPEAKTGSIFVFVGDADALILLAYGVISVVLIALIILMMRKKRRGVKQ